MAKSDQTQSAAPSPEALNAQQTELVNTLAAAIATACGDRSSPRRPPASELARKAALQYGAIRAALRTFSEAVVGTGPAQNLIKGRSEC